VGDRDSANELMQETFVHALRSAVDPASLRSARTWLFRIATNLAHDWHRRQRVAVVPLTDGQLGSGSVPDGSAEIVRHALAAVPYHEAATLLLRYESGFSREEMQGVGVEAVKSRLRRGRANFIRRYDELTRGTT
jgi:DNA-directed RNA polymerase specialized sigma24 family protein